MPDHNISILTSSQQANYILSPKGLRDLSSKANFYRRFVQPIFNVVLAIPHPA